MLLLFEEDRLYCVLLCGFLLLAVDHLKQLRSRIDNSSRNLNVIWLLERVDGKGSFLDLVLCTRIGRKIYKFLPLTPLLVQIRALPFGSLHLANLCKVIIWVSSRWRSRADCCHLLIVPSNQKVLWLIIHADWRCSPSLISIDYLSSPWLEIFIRVLWLGVHVVVVHMARAGKGWYMRDLVLALILMDLC